MGYTFPGHHTEFRRVAVHCFVVGRNSLGHCSRQLAYSPAGRGLTSMVADADTDGEKRSVGQRWTHMQHFFCLAECLWGGPSFPGCREEADDVDNDSDNDDGRAGQGCIAASPCRKGYKFSRYFHIKSISFLLSSLSHCYI